ncbi:hypothetical protein UCDDA912_g00906 [Diaporthe ampelina]|uniref:Uncharacterized protein n=1 Tax=Diaporthe ampelina TaxID=1214573 RepID=A0A0G2FZ01_9PEZI|nr:hypothetical protein UCDDA912_g00906 [Diaporthe ampelina]
MRLRLHYERKTWDDKYGAIRNSCQKIIQDFAAASNSLQNYLSNADDGSGVVDLYQVMSQLHTLFRQDLLELHRLVDYESRYSQCVAAEYFLKDLDDRWLVRRSMHVLLGHLQATCGQVGGILQAMMEIWKGMGADAAFAEQVQECETLYSRINTAQTAIFSVVQVLRGNTLGERSGPGGHGPLAAVPVALRELRNGRNLRVAAMREYARIGDPKLRRLIQTWLNIIHFSQDIRHDDPDADDVVGGGGSIAELRRARDQAAGDALAISYLDRQDQVEANRAQGIGPAEGEDLVAAELQDEMAQLELSSEIVDLYSHSFSEEEQDRLRRRSF